MWDLAAFPSNIYPDEIMTGQFASEAYLGGSNPSIFTTLWGEIDLPALWFLGVAASLKLGGATLVALRLPAALFGAAAVLPFYGLVRSTWGRTAAIAGTAILAFSASNVHYSRLALNNILPQFFWAACFFFLLRGLHLRRPADWALAGLAAGLSEYGFYATRLLPFVLLAFLAYLLVAHWHTSRRYLGHFGLLVLSYIVGFGPLLVHFVRDPRTYLGHGSSVLIWDHFPQNWQDLQAMAAALWPAISNNMLGFSTLPSQDIIYFAPLLLPAEAALLVIGVALLIWRWQHPAAFLVLLSGLSVLFVGGTLVRDAPSFNHWTPAFPAFYAALAVPIGAWVESARTLQRWNILTRLTPALGLILLAWLNIDFYFRQYYANPDLLIQENYRTAQGYYEIQTMQSRYQATLGPNYIVRTVGRNTPPYDPATTSYLVKGQDWARILEPERELPLPSTPPGKELAFIFFPGNEQYQQLVRSLYQGGVSGEVRSIGGKHLFYTYVLTPR